MKLREAIGAIWPGWRRAGPLAGSAAAHVVLGAAIAAILALAARSNSADPTPRLLEVTLVAESEALPPPGMRPTPPQARRPPPSLDKAIMLPDKPPIVTDTKKSQPQQRLAEAPAASGGAPADPGGVYLGASLLERSGVPLGLRSLYETDPCNLRNKAMECATHWARRMALGDPAITPSNKQLAGYFPGIRLPTFGEADAWRNMSKDEAELYYGEFIPDCSHWVGCEGKEWISASGTRSTATKSLAGTMLRNNPMAGGAGRLGGIHELASRLPQQPDFVDRGFGD